MGNPTTTPPVIDSPYTTCKLQKYCEACSCGDSRKNAHMSIGVSDAAMTQHTGSTLPAYADVRLSDGYAAGELLNFRGMDVGLRAIFS